MSKNKAPEHPPFKQTVYCNTVYRETPVVHPVINKPNNKNKFNLHRHSLEGQWFSILPWQGMGAGGCWCWGVETVTSFLVLACSNTIFINISIEILLCLLEFNWNWLFFYVLSISIFCVNNT